MKKRLLCFITLIAIMVSFVPSVMAKNHDPYAGIMFKDYDETTMKNPTLGGYEAVNSLRNSYVVFKDLSFGADSPARMVIDAGGAAGQLFNLQFRLDSPTGEMILETGIDDTSWKIATYEKFLTKEVTGKHDLYIINTGSGTANLLSFRFIKPTVKIEGFPEYPLKDAYSDIADNQYREKINLVHALGLLDEVGEGKYGPDLGVTRGEFARAIYRLISQERGEKISEKPFDDVEYDAEFAEAVANLKNENIIMGNDDNTFRPYELISVEDAAVIICRMLKLEPLATVEGGYIEGYLAIAQEEGILKGINRESRLQRSSFAQMIYNAINAHYMDFSSISLSEGIVYNMVSGILSEKKDIYRSEIYIEETSYTGIFSPETSLQSKTIKSGNDIYNTGTTGAEAYIGMTCECYWQDVDGERNIIYLMPKNTRNIYSANTWEGNEIEIDENQVTVYDENGKTTVKNISQYTVIYNGKSLDVPLNNVITAPFKGSVRIVSEEKNPIIFIEQYKDIVIQGFDITNMIFLNKLTNQSINALESELAVTFNGEPATLDNVVLGASGSYYVSVNSSGKKLIRFLLNNKPISGTVTKNSSDKIAIDGIEYRKASSLSSNIQIGMNADFYVNEYNEIIFANTVSMSSFNMGVFLDYKNAPDEEKFYLKIANQDGEVVKYECAESVTADGIKVKNYTDLENGFADFDGFANVDKQSVMLYRINSDNLVTAVDTYLDGTGKNNDVLKRVTDSDVLGYYNNKVNALTISGCALYPIMKDSALVKHMPEIDNDKYSFSDVSTLTTGYNVSVVLYSTLKDSFYSNIVVLKNNEDLGKWQNPSIFENKVEAINDNDEYGYNIVCYGTEGYTEYFASEESISNNTSVNAFLIDADPGDWVQIRTNSDGMVTNARILYKYDGSNSEGVGGKPLLSAAASGSGSMTKTRYIAGKVVDIENGLLRVDTSATSDEYVSVNAEFIAQWGIENGSRGTKILYNNRVSKENIMIGADVLIYVNYDSTIQILVKSLN